MTIELMQDGSKKVTSKDGSAFLVCACGHWFGRKADSCECCNGGRNKKITAIGKEAAKEKGMDYRPVHGDSPHLAVMLP